MATVGVKGLNNYTKMSLGRQRSNAASPVSLRHRGFLVLYSYALDSFFQCWSGSLNVD